MRDDFPSVLFKARQDIVLEGVIGLMKGRNDLLLSVPLRGIEGLLASFDSLIGEGTELLGERADFV